MKTVLPVMKFLMRSFSFGGIVVIAVYVAEQITADMDGGPRAWLVSLAVGLAFGDAWLAISNIVDRPSCRCGGSRSPTSADTFLARGEQGDCDGQEAMDL